MTQIDDIITRISATMMTGEDQILFRRRLSRHVEEVMTLRSLGLTWDQIARKLTAHGVRHKRGQPVSAHQLRTEYGRLRAEVARAPVTPVDPAKTAPRATGRSTLVRPLPPSRAGAAFETLSALTRTRVRNLEVDE